MFNLNINNFWRFTQAAILFLKSQNRLHNVMLSWIAMLKHEMSEHAWVMMVYGWRMMSLAWSWYGIYMNCWLYMWTWIWY